MATLNMGNVTNSDLKNVTAIGYNASTKLVRAMVSKAPANAGYTAVKGSYDGSGAASGNYSVTLADPVLTTAVTQFTDTKAGRNWTIVGGKNLSTVTTGAGKDSVLIDESEVKLNITTNAGNDNIDIVTAKENVTINAGAGADSVYVHTAKADLKVELGAGKDSLTVKQADGAVKISATSGSDANRVVIGTLGANASLDVKLASGHDSVYVDTAAVGSIEMGSGNDYVSLQAGAKNASIKLGDGADSLLAKGLVDSSTIDAGNGNDIVSITAGAKDSTVSLGDGNDSVYLKGDFADTSLTGGAGSDVFVVSEMGSGTVTVTDFDLTKDVVVTGAKFAADASKFGVDGIYTFADGKAVKANTTGNFYALRVKQNATGESDVVGWGTENGGVVNASSMTESVVLIGSNNDDAVDTLMGGSKADSIFAGKGDYVYGGAGDDSIQLIAGDEETEYIGLTSAGGKDSVYGFGRGKDAIYLFQNDASNVKLSTDTSSHLVAKVGTATLTIADSNVTDEYKFKLKDKSGTTYNVDYVADVASIGSDLDEMSGIYYAGSKSASLDFDNVDDALVVDLDNRNIIANTKGALYYGDFASVKGGKDNTILMGSANNKNTLVAGTGNTTIWGGGSKNDSLVGNTEDNDTNVVFRFGDGDGKDTINNGQWGKEDNKDVLWLASSKISSIKNDGTNTTIALAGSDKVTLEGFTDADTVLKFTTDGTNISKAKIGVKGAPNSWTYDEEVSLYVGGSKNTLTVSSDVDSANIWLNGSTGVTYENVTTIDASSNAGNVTLAGAAAGETLIAGSGDASLWGAAGNDTLQGGNGGTTNFYFGQGDGSDIISGSGEDDKVVLYNVGLNNVAALNDTDGNLKITLQSGDSLTIQGGNNAGVHTFQLADGSTWSYDYDEKTWSQA